MAVLAQSNYTKVGDSYGSLTAGELSTYTAAAGGGDFVPLVGQYVLLVFKTAGTASVITIDSVAPSNQGSDENITVTMGATEEREVLIDLTTGGNRFKQTSGNVGYLALTYTSVVALTLRAKSIA